MSGLRLAALACLVVAAGCAVLEREPPSPEVERCQAWYRDLDRAVEEAGVRDAQDTRVRGFPYLRVDRLHASLRDKARTSEAALHAWVDALLDLDRRGRLHELRNLPNPPLSPHEALQRTVDCGRLLREIDLAQPERRAALVERARVPDDYSDASRMLGLYPLTRLVFAAGVRRWEEAARAPFATRPGAPPDTVIRYAPPARVQISRAAIAGVLARSRTDPLGRPTLTEPELLELGIAYAPTFEVEVKADYDRPGALHWRAAADTPEVDNSRSVVYLSATHTRYRRGPQDHILLQLVYTIWFAERPPLEEADLLAGRLDGLVWRVTLAPDGEPLLYDSMHPCGCYHQFFPTPRARLRPAPDPREEWAFVPQSVPRVADGDRPRVRVASATHYIEGIELAGDADARVRYDFRDADELRSLPRGAGSRSAFGPDGLIAGTERAERFLFWPMGIASAGAMRQWGRHATAFVGRRHFDDADLLERRFDLDLRIEPR
jgi:hypothetical protein